MTTILRVDGRSNAAKAFLKFVKSLPFVTIEEKGEKTKKTAVQQSIQEEKEGKVNTYKSVDDFFEKVLN